MFVCRLTLCLSTDVIRGNHNNSIKTGLKLIKKVWKESVLRNQNNSVKTGLRLKEKSPKESVPRNHKRNLKQPGQRESKRIKTENDSDDDWVWELTWIWSSMPTRF